MVAVDNDERQGAVLARSREQTPKPPAIDLTHLARMTLGDRVVERDVLSLFQQQIVAGLAEIAQADWTGMRTLAHSLKGTALAVGAGRLAAAAAAVEFALQDPADGSALAAAMARLTAAAIEARTAIDEMTHCD